MTPCVGLVSWLAIDSLHRVADIIQAVFHGVDRSLTAVSLLYSGSIHPFIDMVILCGENCAISIQKNIYNVSMLASLPIHLALPAACVPEQSVAGERYPHGTTLFYFTTLYSGVFYG